MNSRRQDSLRAILEAGTIICTTKYAQGLWVFWYQLKEEWCWWDGCWEIKGVCRCGCVARTRKSTITHTLSSDLTFCRESLWAKATGLSSSWTLWDFGHKQCCFQTPVIKCYSGVERPSPHLGKDHRAATGGKGISYVRFPQRVLPAMVERCIFQRPTRGQRQIMNRHVPNYICRILLRK